VQAREEREQLADKFEDGIDDIHEEMRGGRGKLVRLGSLDDAVDTERYPDEWLD
jgi:hypothetical protein